jgi:hypothetical protein
MPAFRGAAFAGVLGALLLAGCASYPSTTYYYDDGGYAGGDYSYGERWDDDGYVADGGYWSPAWSVYYSTILYPPYWRSYDPWYTPGWYYGYRYAPNAGWRIGWSRYSYDPWWGGGWHSPYRSGWYDPYRYGWYDHYGHGGWYGWYGHDSRRAWRDYERRYGRRGYEDWRRSGGDRRAGDEAERIARRSEPDRAAYAPQNDGRGYRGSVPDAYDRRERSAALPGRPSRFGNPEAAPPRAEDRGQPQRGDGLLGGRDSGWVAPASGGSDGAYSRRGAPIGRGDDADPREAPVQSTRWRNDGGYRSDGTPQRGERARETWSTERLESRDDGYRRRGLPRGGDAPAYGTPADPPAPRYERREYSRESAPVRFEAPPRSEAPRFERQESPRFERQEMPRYERQEAPQYQRQETPRFERQEAPRFERQEAPRFERQESPRFDPPSRNDDDGGSASRQLERIVREDE